jgi:LPXTG-motif cell wall-anchored protein
LKEILKMKRIIAIALAVVMVLSIGVVAAYAADVNDANVGADSNNSIGADTSSSTTGAGDLVYFDASGWKNFKIIYCHVWKRGGDSFFGWQLKKEVCKKVSGNKWSYDLSTLDLTDKDSLKGGLKSGEDYCIIFSSDIKQQTYDATFSKSCIGDTLKLTGKKIENPVDSEQKADEAVWSKNSSSYGPHLAFTSIGNIVGSKLCPNEKGTEVIGDWLPAYYKSKFVKPVPALAKAFPKFGISSASQIQDIYAYIISKKTGEDEKSMKKMLEDAFAKAYPSKKGEAKIDEKAAEKEAKDISNNGGHVTSSASSAGSSSSSGSTGSSNSSGSGADGEEDTILFILFGVMLAAAAVVFVTRKKRTE